jgi:hypothetical protein
MCYAAFPVAWLAKLDARARQWPTPARWAYVGLKWYLALLGAFALLRVSLDRMGLWSLYTDY